VNAPPILGESHAQIRKERDEQVGTPHDGYHYKNSSALIPISGSGSDFHEHRQEHLVSTSTLMNTRSAATPMPTVMTVAILT
jgi:hypothetical protein